MLHWFIKKIYHYRHKNKINILIYHQVVKERDPMRPSEPTAVEFDWQMKLLSKYFTPLSLDDALKAIEQNNIPPNAVVVTFDDGYLNNLTVAQPILEKYKVPATFYIATGFCSGRNMWNDRIINLFANKQKSSLQIDKENIELGTDDNRRDLAYKFLDKMKYLNFEERLNQVDYWYQTNDVTDDTPMMMTPEQVIKLSQKPGVTIGAHTVDHPILQVHTADEQKTQILESKQTLEHWLNQPIEHFAYPNGKQHRDFDNVAQNIVTELGFKTAVATNPGKCSTASDRLALPRFTPWDKTPLRFHLRLAI